VIKNQRFIDEPNMKFTAIADEKNAAARVLFEIDAKEPE
jgi:hypothetical protein